LMTLASKRRRLGPNSNALRCNAAASFNHRSEPNRDPPGSSNSAKIQLSESD
jgi:hypothetical protein